MGNETFYGDGLNDPILCQGIKLIPRLSLWGEMPFTKVCVTSPYDLFIVYYHFATQTNIYVESLKEEEAREPKKAKKAKKPKKPKNKAGE